MTFDAHLKRGHVVTFGLLILWSLIAWATAAWLVGNYHHGGSLGTRVDFLLFVGLWTFFFSILYIVGFLKATTSFAFSIASHAVWLFVTWVFWLAGAAALTDTLGMHWQGGHANTLYALEAFAWINFIIVTLMFVAVIFTGMRSARSGNGFGGAMVDV